MATILIIEDNPHQALLYRMELEDDGHTVITSGEATEGIQLAREHHPDLAVVDLGLPGMDGMEAVGRLLGLDSRLPVIIHTASPMAKDDFRAWAADAYILKSSDCRPLRREIERLLSERGERSTTRAWMRKPWARAFFRLREGARRSAP